MGSFPKSVFKVCFQEGAVKFCRSQHLPEWVSELRLFTAGETWGGTNSVSLGHYLEKLRGWRAQGTPASRVSARHSACVSHQPWVNIMSCFSPHLSCSSKLHLMFHCRPSSDVIYYSSQKSFRMIPWAPSAHDELTGLRKQFTIGKESKGAINCKVRFLKMSRKSK